MHVPCDVLSPEAGAPRGWAPPPPPPAACCLAAQLVPCFWVWVHAGEGIVLFGPSQGSNLPLA